MNFVKSRVDYSGRGELLSNRPITDDQDADSQLATDTQNPSLSRPTMILTGRAVAHESGRVSGNKLTTVMSVSSSASE